MGSWMGKRRTVYATVRHWPGTRVAHLHRMGKSPRAHFSSLPRSAYSGLPSRNTLTQPDSSSSPTSVTRCSTARTIAGGDWPSTRSTRATGVATWPMRADVPEATIEGAEEASHGSRGSQQVIARRAGEALVDHGVDIVARVPKGLRSAGGDVLVELDLTGTRQRGTRLGRARPRRPLRRGYPPW